MIGRARRHRLVEVSDIMPSDTTRSGHAPGPGPAGDPPARPEALPPKGPGRSLGGRSAVVAARARRVAVRHGEQPAAATATAAMPESAGPAAPPGAGRRLKHWRPWRAAAAKATAADAPTGGPAEARDPPGSRDGGTEDAQASVFRTLLRDAQGAPPPVVDEAPATLAGPLAGPAPCAIGTEPATDETVAGPEPGVAPDPPLTLPISDAPVQDTPAAEAPDVPDRILAVGDSPADEAGTRALDPAPGQAVAPEPPPALDPGEEPARAKPAAPEPGDRVGLEADRDPAPRTAALDAAMTAELGPGMQFRLRQLGFGSDAALAEADPATLRAALGEISHLLNVELWIEQARRRRPTPRPEV